MAISAEKKQGIIKELVERLQTAPEISKIIILGSFLADDLEGRLFNSGNKEGC